jgi:hypothetical protein
MKELLSILLLAILVVALLPWVIAQVKTITRGVAHNSLVHPDGKISLKPTAAITTRFLIGKRGASASLVAVAAAGNVPLCIIEDTATADDVTLGTPLACALLGATVGTVRMVAAGAIAADVDVYSIGNGKVEDLAGAATGDYRVGRSVTAAAADGDEIVVVPCLPVYTKPA